MTMTSDDPIYAMGRSEGERRRLVEQAAIYAASTRHLLDEAGIGSGLRVLDAGCGVGDVTLLVASVVGPDGGVVGVDTDAEALAVGRARAARAGLDHVRFVQGDLRDLSFDHAFDAVVGRFVLMYLADPCDAVRRLSGHVRPGGVVAFQEFQFEGLMRSYPDVAGSLYERAVGWVRETLRRAGVETEMGLRLPTVLRDAGLTPARGFVHCPLAGGTDDPAYSLLAHVLESLLPLIVAFGVATPEEVDPDSFARRLSDEATAHDAVGCCPPVVGAWASLPDHRLPDHQ